MRVKERRLEEAAKAVDEVLVETGVYRFKADEHSPEQRRINRLVAEAVASLYEPEIARLEKPCPKCGECPDCYGEGCTTCAT